MRSAATTHLPARERGAALLILLAIVSTAIIYAFVAGLNRSAADLALERTNKTTTALSQAKEALIAYAVTYMDDTTNAIPLPGFLPCPDMGPGNNPEGEAVGSCGSRLVSSMGKLPWKTLGLDALKDGSNECLWYAVSGTYKNSPNGVTTNSATSNMMNWDTNGQFDVMDANGTSFLAGLTPDTRAVAVIFSPGSAISGQARNTPSGWLTPSNLVPACGGNYTAAAYLETANSINNSVVSGTASAQSTFIAGTKSDTFNDQLVYITRADIWNAIKKRSDFKDNNYYLRALTRRAAECIAMYGSENNFGITDKRLPWASNVPLSNYVVNSRYRDDSSYLLSGRLPYRVSISAPNTSVGTDNSSSSPYYLYAAWPGSYCSYASTPNEQVWYDHWKDHLFYAVADSYKPAPANKLNTQCGTCLQVNGSGSYAAVVIFAGEKLSSLSQSRNTTTEKGLIGNYLEDQNSTRIAANSGSGSYKAAGQSSTFNDIVYSVDNTLLVKCYSASSLTMVSVPAVPPAPAAPPAAPPTLPGPVGPYAACP